jgi:DNA-nicking Smr family endonuclease|tara:strand:- start:1254 stop:1664 length:411 start_codon:yes stop_codon:yes gene_type:complete
VIKKISDKDKQDWDKFLSSSEKIRNKDLNLNNKVKRYLTKTVDLHGYSIEEANKTISDLINKCFLSKTNKIKVITGKGLRSKNKDNPYLSEDLSILKYSVEDYIRSNKDLVELIKEIKEAKIEDGGSGAFYIYLKK